MKKFLILLILLAGATHFAQAQKLNADTLAKYSKKTEQFKVFNKVAADIHLDKAQTEKFASLSATYSDKAIAIVKDDKNSRCDKLGLLRKTLKEYTTQIKQVLSPEQMTLLLNEREKYHFGRRFVTFND